MTPVPLIETAALLAEKDARIQELLEAINREVERRREAERQCKVLAARLTLIEPSPLEPTGDVTLAECMEWCRVRASPLRSPYNEYSQVRFRAILAHLERTGDVTKLRAALTRILAGKQIPDPRYPGSTLVEDLDLDEIQAICEAALAETGPEPCHAIRSDGPRWRHRKRGTVYVEIGRAELQASLDMLVEGDRIVVYRDDHSRLWCRREDEFEDGRFERLPAEPLPEGAKVHFSDWLGGLNVEAAKRGYAGAESFWQGTGADCWRDYYAEGRSPAEALDEDESHGDVG